MEDMQNLIGQTLGQYQIIEQIGAGGMATVFKAYQPGLNRHVAVKVLPPYFAKQADFTERFTREAQAIALLNHPNILPVYDSGQDKGYSYIVMRYVPGAITLTNLMKQSLETEQVVKIVAQIAAALDHAHQSGIIHRDIKPSNVLMDGDWVLLSDFGMAKIVEAPSELTGTGVGLGTPTYMSPEQGLGEKADHRSDIYSLGIILYEMLTGQIPHQAETPIATVMKRLNDPLPLPRSLNPDIPEAVEEVLLKALAFKPEHRFDRAGALAEVLKVAFEDKPDQEISAPEPEVYRSQTTASPISQSQPALQPARLDEGSRSQGQIVQSGARGAPEVIVLTLLGMFSLCGVMVTIFSLIPPIDRTDFGMLFIGLGMLVAALSSAAMTWFRSKARPASAALAVAILSWFFGLNILGFSGFAALTPSEQTTQAVVENLGFTAALCWTPGGFLTLLGLFLYAREHRLARRARHSGRVEATGSGRIAQTRADKLRRADEYVSHITRLIRRRKLSTFTASMTSFKANLRQWETGVGQLVDRLDAFEANPILQRDIREVPVAIANLKRQLDTETDPDVRTQMRETLTSYEEHQNQLASLVRLMRRTELEIDESMASVGAIYSQLQLLDAKDIDSSRAERLSEDIDEQASRLGDLLSAMDDVYREASSG